MCQTVYNFLLEFKGAYVGTDMYSWWTLRICQKERHHTPSQR